MTDGWRQADCAAWRFLPMFRPPVLIFAVDAPDIRRAYARAVQRGVEQFAIYWAEFFATGHDPARRAAAVAAGDLDLVGIALRAGRKVVAKVLDRLRPHS